MYSDWSVECGAEDPVLVVPWSASEAGAEHAASTVRFVDLRAHPDDLDLIPEADRYPALLHALRALNATRSPVFTAKCDAWQLDPDELEALSQALEVPEPYASAPEPYASTDHPPHTRTGFGSYIDLLWRDRAIFISLHQHEQMLHRLFRHAAALDHPAAALECTIRPALLDLAGPIEGYAVTLYLKALGDDQIEAQSAWSNALAAITALLRSKDLAFT